MPNIIEITNFEAPELDVYANGKIWVTDTNGIIR